VGRRVWSIKEITPYKELMIIKNKIFYRTLLLLFCVFYFFGHVKVVYGATVKLLSYDLVDAGKHCDVDYEATKYSSYVKKGMSTWNAYKKGVLRKDSIYVLQDVYCSDSNKANGNTIATTFSSSKSIVFYKKNMDTLSSARKQHTATHELGHCLGIAHLTQSDVMSTYNTTRTALSSNDKASYNSAYRRY
jgi:predicted Zn-dependent protease